ncbi:MAG: hypothetical protein AAF739_08660 [Pseudomonadota bacterium]
MEELTEAAPAQAEKPVAEALPAQGDPKTASDDPVSQRPSALPGFTEAILAANTKHDVGNETSDPQPAEADNFSQIIASGPVRKPVNRASDPKKRKVQLKGQKTGNGIVRKLMLRLAGFGVPFGVVTGLALLTLTIPMRDHVVRIFPDLAGLYEIAGLSVNVRGIAFSSFTATREVVAGLPVMEIEGTLTNITEREQPLQPLRIALTGNDGEELFSWVVRPDIPQLGPGETLPVSSELTAPPPNASGIALRFLRDGERVPGG